MDPEQRGQFLEEPPEGAPDIDKAHEVVLLCFHLQACWDYREQACVDALGWLQTHTCVDTHVAATHTVQHCAAQSIFTTLGSC